MLKAVIVVLLIVLVLQHHWMIILFLPVLILSLGVRRGAKGMTRQGREEIRAGYRKAIKIWRRF